MTDLLDEVPSKFNDNCTLCDCYRCAEQCGNCDGCNGAVETAGRKANAQWIENCPHCVE